MQGVVTDAQTGRPMLAVTVVNEITQQVSITDEHGVYAIPANTGETIAFSYVGYKTVEKVKPISVIIATQNIRLEPSNTQLQEFIFHVDKRTKYQIDSEERRVIYRKPLSRKPPSPIMSPVSALAELFSKKAKREYAFQKTYQNDELNRFIDTRYTNDLVTKLTGLKGDSLARFMYDYPMPYDYARTATDLELKMWIRDSYRLWIKTYVAPKDTVQTITIPDTKWR